VGRQLAPGITTRVFDGEQAMVSIVTLKPFAVGLEHSHPEEQWGFLLEGSAVRAQGGVETPVKPGDFWRTPGGTAHSLRAGEAGALVLDIFSPPRQAYRQPGVGFGSGGRTAPQGEPDAA
jgi:quercetin dioxygenase-like cupin family protein